MVVLISFPIPSSPWYSFVRLMMMMALYVVTLLAHPNGGNSHNSKKKSQSMDSCVWFITKKIRYNCDFDLNLINVFFSVFRLLTFWERLVCRFFFRFREKNPGFFLLLLLLLLLLRMATIQQKTNEHAAAWWFFTFFFGLGKIIAIFLVKRGMMLMNESTNGFFSYQKFFVFGIKCFCLVLCLWVLQTFNVNSNNESFFWISKKKELKW